MLAGIRRELLAPEVLAEFKRRVVKRVAETQGAPAVDHNRIRELEGQVANLTEATGPAWKATPKRAQRRTALDPEATFATGGFRGSSPRRGC
jgi:hypothetical protein